MKAAQATGVNVFDQTISPPLLTSNHRGLGFSIEYQNWHPGG